MVHTVVVEDRVESVLKELLSSKQVQVGLLIGQVTKSKDYVLLAVRTPSLQELNDNEEAKEKSSSSSGAIEDWWIVEHAKQVINLLPGGVGVVGVFCVSPKEVLPTLQPRLVKALAGLLPSQESARPHTKGVLLHYCSVTRKSKGQVIDMGNQLGGFRPAEVKCQPKPVQLVKVESDIRLSCDWYGHLRGNTSQVLLKSVQATVGDTVDKVFSHALLKVNGRFVDEGDPLIVKTKKGEQLPSDATVKLDIFTKHPLQSVEDVEVVAGVRRVGVAGSLSLSAFLHPKASYGDALTAVKEDALRSLTSQLIALTESDSVQESSDGLCAPLPSRVPVTVPDLSWPLSEYSFPGEDITECEARVCDLLGVTSATAISPFSVDDKPTLTDSAEVVDKDSTRGQLWPLIAAVVVLIIAIVTWAVLFS